jgi:hypothetical protein
MSLKFSARHLLRQRRAKRLRNCFYCCLNVYEEWWQDISCGGACRVEAEAFSFNLPRS